MPARRFTDALRTETLGGVLLIGAALIGLVWANSPWASAYHEISGLRIGPAAWHLDLSLAAWASDGLLAIFFFVAGLELKREFVAGELRDPRRAVLPVAAAVGGMAAPAVIYTLINAVAGSGALQGWAIPTATDIAFALAVLAVIGKNLPSALRTFLLTLAVVDDLLAITIIAIFYTASLQVGWLLLALVPLGLFALLARRGFTYILLPLAAATWVLVHASGVHATVAGVLLAFTVPVRTTERFEHRWRPVSAGIAVPVFAFFAAGVSVSLGAGLFDAVTVGVIAGLVLGKTIGITASTWLVQRFTRAELAEELRWPHVVGLGMLGGIGFTVSLLIGELAFGAGTERNDHAKIGVLLGSLISTVIAAVLLRTMKRKAAP